ncbi:MAG: hypothetical protein V4726_12320 [Verrucomicrobiota bacterium]
MKLQPPTESIICGKDDAPGYSSLLVPVRLAETFRSYLKTGHVRSGGAEPVVEDRGAVAESLISVKGTVSEISPLIDRWFKQRKWRENRVEADDAVKWEFEAVKMNNALQRKTAVQKRLPNVKRRQPNLIGG